MRWQDRGVTSDPYRDLAERTTAAIERMDARWEAMNERWESMDERWEEHVRVLEGHSRTIERNTESIERLMRRQDRSEQLFISTIADLERSHHEWSERLANRLDDMGDAIRANTQAVLSVLDRLEPGSA